MVRDVGCGVECSGEAKGVLLARWCRASANKKKMNVQITIVPIVMIAIMALFIYVYQDVGPRCRLRG